MRSPYRDDEFPASSPTPSSSLRSKAYESYDNDVQERFPSPELFESKDFEIVEPPTQFLRAKPRWRRILAPLVPGRPAGKAEAEGALPLLSSGRGQPPRSERRSRKCRFVYCLLFPLLGFFVMLGIAQFASILCGIVITYFPDEFDRAAGNWLHRDNPTDASRWPTDISRDIVPVGCHSHNDYWRRVPLFSALQAGCIGVEADVWLFDEQLYVGHTTSALTPNRTLRSMYVDPLVKIIDEQNPTTKFHPKTDEPPHGVFDTDPSQTLVLLIDFKTHGATTWPYLVEQLSPLRDRGYLSYYDGEKFVNGPITVVGTGETPFDLVMASSTHREIFFDAPLELLAESGPEQEQSRLPKRWPDQSGEDLGQGLSGISEFGTDAFNHTNSYYASVSFKKSIGFPWPFHFTPEQMDLIRAQVRGAHQRGLKVRYWGIPDWPRSLRNHIWSILVQEGVDILNVDDLKSATKKEWTVTFSDWL